MRLDFGAQELRECGGGREFAAAPFLTGGGVDTGAARENATADDERDTSGMGSAVSCFISPL
jgi:hypothetical protein